MTPESATPAIPKGMRSAAIAVILLSSLVGFAAASEAMGLGSLDKQRHRLLEDPPDLPLVDPQSLRATTEAQFSALEGMKGPRAFVLGALAVACIVAFVSALRLIRPDGLPREGVRRVLGFSLLAAAALRTIDGAQFAVVMQRAGRAAAVEAARMVGDQPTLGPDAVGSIATAGVVLYTLLIAGGFLLLGQYFRSQKVKELVALQDRQLGR